MSTSTVFSLDDLRRILVICADGIDGGVAGGRFADTSFTELGYDSMALMEAAVRIEQDYGVRIADGDVAAARTPRDMLNLVTGAAGNGGAL